MEQHESMKMRNVYKIIRVSWVVTWIVMGTACSRPMENPELIDPIYLDLKKLTDEYSKKEEEIRKNREESYKKFLALEANTLDKKLEFRTYSKYEKQLARTSEMAKYYKIRMERRKIEGKKEYLESFSKGEPWPKPEEHKAFLINQKLRTANLNWETRVPKLADRYSRTPAAAKKPEKKKEAEE